MHRYLAPRRDILFLVSFCFTLLGVGNTGAQVPPAPWHASEVIQQDVLAKEIAARAKKAPLILQVGFDFLYKQGHIPGALEAGAGRDSAGLQKLKSIVAPQPHNREIVLYCGCCPWSHCPNVRPAFEMLRKMGFRNVRVLYLPDNFDKDWMQRGYPVEHTMPASGR